MEFISILVVLIIIHVDAHFVLTYPVPRELNTFNPIPGNEKGIANPLFICGGFDTVGTPAPLDISSPISVTMKQNAANHCGDCFGYMSYDIGKAAADQKYFLISKSQDYINPNPQSLGPASVTFPTWLPNGQAIFRWQCHTLHQGPPEFYSYCADVTISGGAAPGSPIPTGYTVVGHMPTDGYGSCGNIIHTIGPLIETNPSTGNNPSPTASPPGMTPAPTVAGATSAPTAKVITSVSSAPTPPPTFAPAPAPPGGGTTIQNDPNKCEDQNGEASNCPNLVQNALPDNLCNSFKSWMHVHCAKTCDVCGQCKGDQDKNCAFWASQNECLGNPVWMKENCGQSCGYCMSYLGAGGGAIKVNNIIWFFIASIAVYMY